MDRAREFHRGLIVIDGHSDILLDVTDGFCRLGERYQPEGPTTSCVRGQVDLPRLVAGGVTAQVLAIYVAEHYTDPLRRALDMIAAFERELAANAERMILARSSADVMRAKREGRVPMLLSLEGVEPLGQDLCLLRIFYELGVRLAGLTWNRHNAAADGWDAPPPAGRADPLW